MLLKKHRFSFKEPLPKRILNSQSFSVRYDKNDDELRVAVVVSKRVDKRATVRNKLKRKVLDSIQKRLDTKEPLDLIFYVKKNVLAAKNLDTEIEQAINNLTIEQ